MSQVRMRLKDDETKERDSLLKDNIKSQNDHSGIKERGLCLNRQSVVSDSFFLSFFDSYPRSWVRDRVRYAVTCLVFVLGSSRGILK